MEFKSIEQHVELLKEQFDSVGTKFNGLTWHRIKESHIRYAQQFQEQAPTDVLTTEIMVLRERNEELVEMLEKSQKYIPYKLQIRREIESLITKAKEV